jgi:hypothetical protein
MLNKKNIGNLFIILKILFISSNYLNAQKKDELLKSIVDSKMYIVDTIKINLPLIITATDSSGKFQHLLIGKDDFLSKQWSEQDVFKIENLFCPSYKFTCILDNFISSKDNNKDSVYIKMNILIQNSKAEVWKDFDEIKLTSDKTFSIYTININTFLIILIRNDFLNFCLSRDEIKINSNDKLYRKILIPITW